MNRQVLLRQAINEYGFGWVAARLAYELQLRSGVHTLRFHQRPWDKNELAAWLTNGTPATPDEYRAYWSERRRPFFFKPSDRDDYQKHLLQILGERGLESLAREAAQIQRGEFRYFFSQSGDLGFPPDWHYNPFTGQRTPAAAHWSRIPMFSRETGDLKFIWEPGRFASAYVLARAYWATGDESYAETFWRLIESWAAANPPNQGAHWKCGQETSLRLMAWCFALYAVADSPSTTPERLFQIVGMIAAQADRVARDHVYARLQRNNHAISEGVGLWTVGLLFPELRSAAEWRDHGRKILTEEAARQIAGDGSYIQNSLNYHRLMLQDYIWAARLAETCGDSLPDTLLGRVERAVEFLCQMQDRESGRVPCYGSNDGALILPLNTCDYTDFRPVIAASNYLTRRVRVYEPGPWEEDLLWLFGTGALKANLESIPQVSLSADEGGYYTLRGERGFALTRCTTYRNRPAQADMLHVDLWWRGENIACDAGSYLYYADPPWNNNLIGTAVHNTVTVAGQDQMVMGPRFMWFEWAKAKVLDFTRSPEGRLEVFQGQHDGYLRLDAPALHRRAVLRAGDDVWVVVDDILGQGNNEVACHWLLAEGEHAFDESANRLRLSLAAGEVSMHWAATNLEGACVDITSGDEEKAPRGWRSRYYGVREPALSFQLKGAGRMPCRIATAFVLGESDARVRFDRDAVSIERGDGVELSVTLSPLDETSRLTIIEARLAEGGRIENLICG
ncbi:MAG TPA: alginate lyase family protein [Blastocatellia bacterium]|nr:alginate lyase family protein [Blastocatellia bacterium]